MIKKCIHCGNKYEVTRGCVIKKSKFCTPECHTKYWLIKNNKSGIFIGNKIARGDSIRKNEKLSDLQEKVVVGTLLGDASLDFTRKGSASLRFTHTEKSLDYVKLKLNLLKNFVVQEKPLYRKARECKPINGRIINSKASYLGKTVTHQDFDYMNTFFYKKVNNKNIKIFSQKTYDIVNDVSLIFWYMDDGCLTGYKNINLHTNNFSLKENKLIKKMFFKKFDIESKIYCVKCNKKYFLRINTENTKKLMKIFYKNRKYIPDSMLYKFIFNQQ